MPADASGANPHHSKPAASTDKPHLFDLRGDVTQDKLVTAKGAHYYEFQTLACICYFLCNIILHLERVLPRIIQRVEASASISVQTAPGATPTDVTGREDADALHGTYSSIKGVYNELANKRLQFLQLRSMLTTDKGSVPDDKRGLLEVFTNHIYGAMRDTLPTNLDQTYKKCISEWETSTRTALTKQSASATAKSRAATGTPAANSSGTPTYAAALGTRKKAAKKGGRK